MFCESFFNFSTGTHFCDDAADVVVGSFESFMVFSRFERRNSLQKQQQQQHTTVSIWSIKRKDRIEWGRRWKNPSFKSIHMVRWMEKQNDFVIFNILHAILYEVTCLIFSFVNHFSRTSTHINTIKIHFRASAHCHHSPCYYLFSCLLLHFASKKCTASWILSFVYGLV